MITPPCAEDLPLVRIETAKDSDAARIAAVLQALGYEVVRVFPDAESALVSPAARVGRAVAKLARTHKLTSRQQEVLLMQVQGSDFDEIARALSISRHTVRWHSHNIHCLTCTSDLAELTRKVFDLALQGF